MEKKDIKLKVYANVMKSLFFDPPVTVFYDVTGDKEQTRVIRFYALPEMKENLRIKNLKCTVDFADVEYKKINNKEYEISLKVFPKKALIHYNKKLKEALLTDPKYVPNEGQRIGGQLQLEAKLNGKRKLTYHFHCSLNEKNPADLMK
jgi:hypothetical protein